MQTRSSEFVSLFAGCGGFDIGFLRSGFISRGAFDIDRDAVENFQRNVSSDVGLVDLRNGIPYEGRLRGIDVLIAGPPCQGFSTAGKRRIDDERNSLLTLTGILACRVRPKVVIIENVLGAIAGEHSLYWRDVTQMLRGAGYWTTDLTLQAAQLGMAQFRNRILLIGWRTRKHCRFPLPRASRVVLRDVIGDLTTAPNHEPVFLKPKSELARIAAHIQPGQKLSNVRGGPRSIHTWNIPSVFGATTRHERTLLELLMRLRRQDRKRSHGDADPVSVERLAEAFGAPFRKLLQSLIRKGYVRRAGTSFDLVHTFNGKYRRLAWDAPSCAVHTRFGDPRYFLHPDQQRGFTVREAARIQGFGDEYTFTGLARNQFRLIGNAVPPSIGTVAAAFAKYIVT
jgi:DNA (cytosine-5)-methyltransferase 1